MTNANHRAGNPAMRFSRWTATVLGAAIGLTAIAASADEFTYTDQKGKTVTVSARLAGSGPGKLALELADGEMRQIPRGSVSKRVQSVPPTPITHDQMAEKLKQRFGGSLVRTHVAKPFVVVFIASAPLKRRDERRCESFLKTAGRYLVGTERVFKSFAKRFKLPQHEPRFPLVMLIFESDLDFETYTAKTTNAGTLFVRRISGFYDHRTNWLSIRLTECHDFDTPLHEAIHQQVFNRGVIQRMSPVPLWFHEGIATGFAGDGKRISISPNKLSLRFARGSRKPKRISWAAVVAADKPFRSYGDIEDAYTHAWGMHWLLVTKYKKQYSVYVQNLATKKALSIDSREERVQDFRNAFGKSAAELQAELPRVLAVAAKRQRINLNAPKPLGVGRTQKHLADVRIEGQVKRNGQLEVAGQLFNISMIRPMTFHVTVETNAGMYAEWLVPALANRKKITLRKQFVRKLMKNGRGGRTSSFGVKVRSAVPGTETETRWRRGNLPVPIYGG